MQWEAEAQRPGEPSPLWDESQGSRAGSGEGGAKRAAAAAPCLCLPQCFSSQMVAASTPQRMKEDLVRREKKGSGSTRFSSGSGSAEPENMKELKTKSEAASCAWCGLSSTEKT